MDWDSVGIPSAKVKQGVRSSILCPKCSHVRKKKTDRCLTVNDEEGNRWWNCNHCDFSGNLDLYVKYKGVYEVHSKDERQVFSHTVLTYLNKRGLNPSILTSERVYQSTKFGKIALCYPVFKRKALVNIKYKIINPDQGQRKAWQVSKENGAEMCFLGLDFLNLEKSHDPIVVTIVEGEEDMYSYKTVGVKNVISVPQGAKTPVELYIDKYVIDLFDRVDYFILSVDGDEEGEGLKKRLVSKLGAHRCKYIEYPNGYKDANEILSGKESKDLPLLGKEALIKIHKLAKPFPINGVLKYEDYKEDVVRLHKEGFKPGLMSGFKPYDDLISLKRPYRIIITGIPGMGKTTVFRDFIARVLKNNESPEEELDYIWVMFTPENTRPPEREFSMLLECCARKPFSEMSDEDLSFWGDFVNKHFVLIHPKIFKEYVKTDSKDPLGILMSIVKSLKITYNVFGWSIDPINKIEYHREKFVSESDNIGKVLDLIEEFNFEQNLANIIVCHPPKMDKLPHGNFPIPSLYNISGSAHYFNKADIGIVIHCDDYIYVRLSDGNYKWVKDNNPHIKLIVEKMKFRELGKKGESKLHIDKNGLIHQWEKKTKKTETPKPLDSHNNWENLSDSEQAEIEFYQKKLEDEDDLPF